MASPRNKVYQISEAKSYEVFHLLKKNGKTRRICAPSPGLLRVQRELLPRLYELFNLLADSRHLTDIFHGFVPNKNCVTAARQHMGYDVTLMMDISNFFDSVKIDKINDIIPFNADRVRTCSVYDGTLGQGFATSPILANIYLVAPIAEIRDMLALSGINFVMTVYADDIQISVKNTNYEELASIQEIVTEAMADYDLAIHPHKTRIRWAKYGYRRMLGIGVGHNHMKPSRKLLRKIRCAEHQKNGPSLGGLRTASRLSIPRFQR